MVFPLKDCDCNRHSAFLALTYPFNVIACAETGPLHKTQGLFFVIEKSFATALHLKDGPIGSLRPE